MKEQVIQRIIEDAKRGDFGLVSSLINNMSQDLLYKKLPIDLKDQVAGDFIGHELFVIQKFSDDGSIEVHETVDLAESYMDFNDLVRAKDGSVLQYSTPVLGGSPSQGWGYDLEDSELMQSRIFDVNLMEAKPFKAEVVVHIEGTVMADTDTQDVMDAIELELKPIFITPEFIKTFSKVIDIDLEM